MYLKLFLFYFELQISDVSEQRISRYLFILLLYVNKMALLSFLVLPWRDGHVYQPLSCLIATHVNICIDWVSYVSEHLKLSNQLIWEKEKLTYYVVIILSSATNTFNLNYIVIFKIY